VQKNGVLDKQVSELSKNNQTLNNKVQNLAAALDQKERECLRLKRDFDRVNVHAKSSLEEVENARAVVGEVVGDRLLEEKRKKLKMLEQQMKG
jgi:uncharacterized coiled-coil DUF342 family protein